MASMKTIIYGLTLIFIFLTSVYPASADFTIRSRRVNGISYVHLEDIVEYFGFSAEYNGKTIYLSNRQNQIVFPIGKRKAYLNSIVSQLSFAPTVNRQSYLISEQDFLLLIDPVIRNGSLPTLSLNRIVIDPGHGGHDYGAVGANYMEKNLNLILGKALQSLLIKRGYQVLLTRNDDTFISLRKRGEITRKWNGDLFISIHCNAAPNKDVTGIETYIVTPKGSPSTYKTSIQKKAVPGNAFNSHNARFAYEIQKNLLRLTNADDRGIKYYRWQVLREATCPAVLVETGFLSNVQEERRLGDATYQKQLITGMANGIIEFHKALKK